jgi:hypothetical protein
MERSADAVATVGTEGERIPCFRALCRLAFRRPSSSEALHGSTELEYFGRE